MTDHLEQVQQRTETDQRVAPKETPKEDDPTRRLQKTTDVSNPQEVEATFRKRAKVGLRGDERSSHDRQVEGASPKHRTKAEAGPRHETHHVAPEAPISQAKEIKEAVAQVRIADPAPIDRAARVHETKRSMADQFLKGQDGLIKMKHNDHEVDQPNQAAQVQNVQLKAKTVMAHESFVHNLMPDTAYVERNVGYDTA